MGKREIGLLGAGIGVGVAVALLYAPRSGKVTRRFVRAKANSTASMVRAKADMAASVVKSKATDLRGAAREAVQQGRYKMEAAKDALATAYQVGRDTYSAETGSRLT